MVGVDGEAASIYDVPASRLITSYPIPPQESFTCSPYSIRIRHSSTSEVSRYTFIATKEAASQKITLFKDLVHPDGKTTSTSVTRTLRTAPVKSITWSSVGSQTSLIGDIIAVCDDGEIVSLSGEKLVIQWSSHSRALLQDAVSTQLDRLVVDHVSSRTVKELNNGLFKSRSELLTALPKGFGLESSLLVVLARGTGAAKGNRYMMVMAALPGSDATPSGSQHLVSVDITPLPSTGEHAARAPQYQVDTSSGLLLELGQGLFKVYDLTGAVPKLKSNIQTDASESFTRLSKPFVVSCSSEKISLYNYQYRSIHASSKLDLSELPSDASHRGPHQLIAYLNKHDLVVALIDNVLVCIHVEPPKNHGKRREGLLIDSIGRGAAIQIPSKRRKTSKSSVEFATQLPGTIDEAYLANFQTETEAADGLLANGDLAGWEDFLRTKFGLTVTPGSGKASKADVEWQWPMHAKDYPAVDRRWLLYAISQVFSVEKTDANMLRPRLRLVLMDSNVTTYLALAGHLTASNLRSAFRDEWGGEVLGIKEMSGDLVYCLTEADASMALLLSYIQATRLGEVELLQAIRALMLSMDLIADPEKLETIKLLKDGNDPDVEMDLDVLERELEATELRLSDDNSSRTRGITMALSKLWRLPAAKTIQALRSTLKTEEILSIVHLLRLELMRGSWTSLYVDSVAFDQDGHNEPPPDGIITLIADLLGRCLDAVGAGGWLLNDAMSWADASEAGDFIAALKLEATAALEGVEEAVYLNGVVSEVVRYGMAAQKTGKRGTGTGAVVVPAVDAGGSALPLGLKPRGAAAWVSSEKIVSGGEVVQRSARETGHLISQKVEAYSLEKLRV